jgi:hypothetical protein
VGTLLNAISFAEKVLLVESSEEEGVLGGEAELVELILVVG